MTRERINPILGSLKAPNSWNFPHLYQRLREGRQHFETFSIPTQYRTMRLCFALVLFQFSIFRALQIPGTATARYSSLGAFLVFSITTADIFQNFEEQFILVLGCAAYPLSPILLPAGRGTSCVAVSCR